LHEDTPEEVGSNRPSLSNLPSELIAVIFDVTDALRFAAVAQGSGKLVGRTWRRSYWAPRVLGLAIGLSGWVKTAGKPPLDMLSREKKKEIGVDLNAVLIEDGI
jgi:hypothetical protein